MRRVILVTLAAGALTALLAAQATAAQAPRKGGTLKAMFATDVDFIDPSLAYYAHSWEIMGATGANLLRFADAEGSAGSRIVPEVAAAFPRVSANGRTYVFTLRRGFRFSNGKAVTAQNFAYAIDRALNTQQQSPAGPFMADIVGAQAVLDGKARHASGVVVTNGGYGLRITLSRAAPDILTRLAMPFFQAIDTAVGIQPQGAKAPLHSAGPYYVSAWTPNTRLILKRNPYYKRNKFATRAANIDSFEFDANIALPAQVLRIRAGQSDYGAEGVDPAAHADLARQYGVNRRQYQVRQIPVTYFISMNTTRGLFRDAERPQGREPRDRPPGDPRPARLPGRQARRPDPAAGDPRLPRLPGVAAPLHRGQPEPREAADAGPHHRRAHARRQPRRQPDDPADREVQPREDRDQHGHAAPGDGAAVGHRGPPRRAVRVLPRRLAGRLPGPEQLPGRAPQREQHPRGEQQQPGVLQRPGGQPQARGCLAALGREAVRRVRKLDQDITTQHAPWASLSYANNRDFVSARVGCYSYHPTYSFNLVTACLTR